MKMYLITLITIITLVPLAQPMVKNQSTTLPKELTESEKKKEAPHKEQSPRNQLSFPITQKDQESSVPGVKSQMDSTREGAYEKESLRSRFIVDQLPTEQKKQPTTNYEDVDPIYSTIEELNAMRPPVKKLTKEEIMKREIDNKGIEFINKQLANKVDAVVNMLIYYERQNPKSKKLKKEIQKEQEIIQSYHEIVVNEQKKKFEEALNQELSEQSQEMLNKTIKEKLSELDKQIQEKQEAINLLTETTSKGGVKSLLNKIAPEYDQKLLTQTEQELGRLQSLRNRMNQNDPKALVEGIGVEKLNEIVTIDDTWKSPVIKLPQSPEGYQSKVSEKKEILQKEREEYIAKQLAKDRAKKNKEAQAKKEAQRKEEENQKPVIYAEVKKEDDEPEEGTSYAIIQDEPEDSKTEEVKEQDEDPKNISDIPAKLTSKLITLYSRKLATEDEMSQLKENDAIKKYFLNRKIENINQEINKLSKEYTKKDIKQTKKTKDESETTMTNLNKYAAEKAQKDFDLYKGFMKQLETSAVEK